MILCKKYLGQAEICLGNQRSVSWLPNGEYRFWRVSNPDMLYIAYLCFKVRHNLHVFTIFVCFFFFVFFSWSLQHDTQQYSRAKISWKFKELFCKKKLISF